MTHIGEELAFHLVHLMQLHIQMREFFNFPVQIRIRHR